MATGHSLSSEVYYRDRYWNDIPRVVEHLNERATGVRHPGWMHHLLAHHGRPFQRALILNCGNGWVERELLRLEVVRSAVGVEYLPDLVDEARREAAAGGLALEYVRMDINRSELPAGPFDLVVNHAAAHHIAYIDRVFREVARLLGPDGVFVSWDYVGPHRNQYDAGTWEAAHRLNQSLPPAYRSPLEYPHLPTMLATDPSEAIHSELILPTLERYFDAEHLAPLGGGLAYVLLTHNPAIIDGDPAVVGPLVERILEADVAHTAAVPSSNLFTYAIARPRVDAFDDAAALARWTAEEKAREAEAEARGGVYHPPTLVAELVQARLDLEAALAAATAAAPAPTQGPVGPPPAGRVAERWGEVRSGLRRVPGLVALVRAARSLRRRAGAVASG